MAANPMIHLICGSTGAGKTTYALALASRLSALHLSIDDWMTGLFKADTPARADWQWIDERVRRCEGRMVTTALQLSQLGVSSILDLGLQRAEQRQRVASQLAAAGRTAQLHFLDIDAEERWRRVQRRNSERGETFRLEVTRAMFDFIETIWEPPGAEEMACLSGVRVAT